MAIEVIGIDHIYISVSSMERSLAFYDVVMSLLGFKKNTFDIEGVGHVQFYNRHFGFVLRPAQVLDVKHDPLRVGLHHFCFRVENAEVIDRVGKEFSERGIECSAPQLYPEYAPDYYAIFFADPDGVELEITNYREER